MAMTVIDLLEAIEVDRQQAEMRVFAVGSQCRGELFRKVGAVRQAADGVVPGHAPDIFFRRVFGGDVGDRDDCALRHGLAGQGENTSVGKAQFAIVVAVAVEEASDHCCGLVLLDQRGNESVDQSPDVKVDRRRRESEDVGELPIGDLNPRLAVDHHQPARHIVQRGVELVRDILGAAPRQQHRDLRAVERLGHCAHVAQDQRRKGESEIAARAADHDHGGGERQDDQPGLDGDDARRTRTTGRAAHEKGDASAQRHQSISSDVIIHKNEKLQASQSQGESRHHREIAQFAAPDRGDRRQSASVVFQKQPVLPAFDENAHESGDDYQNRRRDNMLVRGAPALIDGKQDIGEDIGGVGGGALEQGFDQRPVNRRRQRGIGFVTAGKAKHCEHWKPEPKSRRGVPCPDGWGF